MSVYSPFLALKPKSFLPSITLEITTAPSPPALETIVRKGASIARFTICTPVASSAFSVLIFSRAFLARTSATPPPATIPSSTAARVACNASSTRSFFSFISTSEAAPTYSTATPPASLARRS